MTQQDLKKLSRTDLLELLLKERRENELLQIKLKNADKKLSDKTIQIQKAGSIAEAALQLNGVFQAAESAAAQYLENIQRLSSEETAVYQHREEEARKKAAAICTEADAYSRRIRSEADRYQRQVMEQIQNQLRDQNNLRFLLHDAYGEKKIHEEENTGNAVRPAAGR